MSLIIFGGTLELGMIYAILTLGLYISFRILDIPDMTVDGSFVTGAALSVTMCLNLHPFWGLSIAFVGGCIAGCVSCLLNTKLKIQPLLAGILTMMGLYSINLKIMDNKPNISLLNQRTIFNVFDNTIIEDQIKFIIIIVILLIVLVGVFLFLNTKLGFVLRATGNNQCMVSALGVDPDVVKLIGTALSNGLVALSGAILAQYQLFADIGMGVGTIVIGLASIIIGEVLLGIESLSRSLIGIVLGAIIYRFIIAFAFQLGMPPTDLKLISSLIVIISLSIPTINQSMFNLKNKIWNVDGR